jgi:RHS repeat-associated protein
VADQVGAPLVVLDERGEVKAQLVTDSRGRAEVDGDAALCPWRFAGQYRDDETGLHYNRFRYYDADAGQYVSRDPLGLRAGLRVYGYVGDPGVASDPLGLAPAAGEGCGSPRGSNNPATRAAAVTGQEAHRQIERELEIVGFRAEVKITLSDGSVVRKDAVLPGSNVVVIIKPDTPTGIRAAEERAALMESEGYDPQVVLYDPLHPAYQPGSPSYIGPKS